MVRPWLSSAIVVRPSSPLKNLELEEFVSVEGPYFW
jgi:hypothetical protein